MRQFLSLSLGLLLSLASANAYVSKQLPEQIEAAILLNEDGTPRCRIGSAPELDTLRECDEDDELYARTILDAEDINLAMAVDPGKMGEVAGRLLGSGIGATLITCTLIPISNWLFDEPLPEHPAVIGLIASSVLEPIPLVSIKYIGHFINILPTGVAGVFGANLGLRLCSGLGRKSTSKSDN